MNPGPLQETEPKRPHPCGVIYPMGALFQLIGIICHLNGTTEIIFALQHHKN